MIETRAIELLDLIRYVGNGEHSYCNDAQSIALDMAITSIRKQIPKRPLVWENKTYDSPVPNDDWGYECPCCGNRDIDYPDHHCTCGQALDWEFEYRGEL